VGTDGQRFLVDAPATRAGTSMTVVVNRLATLGKK